MAAKSSMMIQFPRGGIIPADVLKLKDDRVCSPNEPVKVPKDYGDHLVERRIAVAVGETTKSKPKAATPKKGEDGPHAALEANVTKAEKAVANAKTDATKAKAQEFLDAANQALADATASSSA